MIEEILFSVYLFLFTLVIIFAGINYYKLRDKHQTNPDIIVFLIPFIVNVIFALIYSSVWLNTCLSILIHSSILFFHVLSFSLLAESSKAYVLSALLEVLGLEKPHLSRKFVLISLNCTLLIVIN